MFKIKFVNEAPCNYTEFAPAGDDKLFYIVEYPYPFNTRFEKLFRND